jgi:lipoprotein-anchoring transpeptidase ErfK/SrfK
MAAATAAAGCSSSGTAGASADAVWTKPSAKPVSFTVTPAADAADVPPGQQIVVSAAGGTLQSVTVAAGGKQVAGTMDADGQTWRSTGTLGYGATYTVNASYVDSLGTATQKTCSFTTLKPTSTASVTFQANSLTALKSGSTYGMGQVVAVRFSKSVSDKTAAEKAIVIETSPQVEGKFFWLDKQTVHWRPEKYWAKGTTIKVSANMLGVNLGGGVYGSSNSSTNFTIGRSLRAVADNNAHYTKVYIDGALVRTMACSMGMGGYTTGANGQSIHFWTQNGVHVVLNKAMDVSMSSASYGLNDPNNRYYYAPEDVKLCTRISYSGEFLHAAPWNMADHGKRNSSHGCINLSIADAQWVYDNFMIGDVVEVTNSPKPLPVWDGLGDWNAPWSSY